MASLNTKKFFIVLVFITINLVLAAASADKITEIIEYYDTIDTYSAQFHQTNYWLELDKSYASNGNIYLKNEKMLLSYEEPEGQLLMVDSTKVLIYDPQRKQAVYSSPEGFDINPRSLLEKYKDSAEIFINDAAERIVDVALDNGESYRFIVEEKLITTIIYTGDNGDYVEYQLLNPVINGNFDDSVFEVDLPRDISIIDNRTGN